MTRSHCHKLTQITLHFARSSRNTAAFLQIAACHLWGERFNFVFLHNLATFSAYNSHWFFGAILHRLIQRVIMIRGSALSAMLIECTWKRILCWSNILCVVIANIQFEHYIFIGISQSRLKLFYVWLNKLCKKAEKVIPSPVSCCKVETKKRANTWNEAGERVTTQREIQHFHSFSVYKILSRSQQLIVICLPVIALWDVKEWKPICVRNCSAHRDKLNI